MLQYVAYFSCSIEPTTSHKNEGGIHVASGNKNMDPYMDIVVDDIMNTSNLNVFDAFKREHFHPSANILLHIGLPRTK